MRMLSLCSGIGGIDLAAEWAGIEVAGQVEIDPFCRAVLARHWPSVPRLEDIFHVRGDEFGPLDLIAGGLPCQGNSLAGYRRGRADERYLWPETARIIRTARPAWVLVENVPGMRSVDGGALFGDVLRDLAGMGYRVGWVSLEAADVGAPHHRERVFIVAYARRAGRQERHVPTISGDTGHAPGRPVAVGSNRQGQPRVGGMFDGLPGGLDGHRWLAGPDEPQHLWEPPRTVTELVPHHIARIRALGNAVVPQQIYPVLAAIAATQEKEQTTDGAAPETTSVA